MIQYRRDLWQLLDRLGNIAEIGVAEGRFSEEMLAWPVQFPRVYLVDRWQEVPGHSGDSSNPQSWHDANYIEVRRRVKPYRDRVVLLRGDSAEMARHVPDSSLILCYVDGDHSYDGVIADIHAWLPKVVGGGIMAFHDYENHDYEVGQAVDWFCRLNDFALHRIPEDKPEDAGAWFRR